ncbi:MAG: Crp/Fnr family transcriptional regulator [bacterium]
MPHNYRQDTLPKAILDFFKEHGRPFELVKSAELQPFSDYPAQQDKRFIWAISSGQLRASLLSAQGDIVWIEDFLAGDIFGDLILHDEQLHVQSLVAIKKTILYRIDKKNLNNFFTHSPHLAPIIYGQQARRLQIITQRMFELSVYDVKKRVCAELLRRSACPELGDTERILRPAPVLADLARYVFSRRETVSRIVNEITREGLIAREPGAIIILSPNAMGPDN